MRHGEGGAQPTKARFALAMNVAHLMATYSKGFDVGLTPVEMEKGCGVSAKTIRRILDPYSRHTPKLDNLDRIGAFFNVETWELLRARPAALVSQVAEVTLPPKPVKPRK